MVSIVILYYNIMGPPSYMWSVVDRNAVMRRVPVFKPRVATAEVSTLHASQFWLLQWCQPSTLSQCPTPHYNHNTMSQATTESCYGIFSNLIRTSFCRSLKRKKVSSRFQSATFLQPPLARNSFRSRAVGVGCTESHPGEHYRQIFQEVLHKQCFGRIRR